MSHDLELLRQRVLEARRNPAPLDETSSALVEAHHAARRAGREVSDLVVTRDGQITTLDALGEADRGISRVTTEVFAAAPAGQSALAREYLPAGHQPIELDDVSGWAYDITTRQGREFTFFLYKDPYEGRYFVRLVAPALEELGLAHETHLFEDGQLCLDPHNAGLALMPDAYAKSVLWADGIGQMLDGHAWPWGE
jgi:hypothetical protein